MNFTELNWEKMTGLIPAIVQDHHTREVLMLGYMNHEALSQTLTTGQVTFYSRSKKRLWMKGETSGNVLTLVSIGRDCDNDAILITVKPKGPCCHLESFSCFSENARGILSELQATIAKRYDDRPENSYVTSLFDAGTKRIAQKVGEEGVEVALASMCGVKAETINEAADLLFHVLVLLKQCEIDFADVLQELYRRHTQQNS